MALQGTLDTFALPDVLRLLASTAKTGCLRVSGGAGRGGEVWFEGGGVIAAQTAASLPTTDPVEVLCELLRCTDGEFFFDAGADHEPGQPADVEPLLAEAEQLVSEWAEIEQVVPSLDSWVSLVDDLPKAKVSIDGASWKVIIAIAGGASVRDIGTWMELGELRVCRAIRGVADLGLVTVSEAPVATGPEAAYDPFEGASPFAREPEGHPETDVDGVAAPESQWDHTPPWADESKWVDDPGYLSFTPERQAAPVYQEVADPEPFAVLDQAATLADALPEVPETMPDDLADDLAHGVADIAAEEVVEPVADDLDDDHDDDPAPIDRSRLLKFLGSVGK